MPNDIFFLGGGEFGAALDRLVHQADNATKEAVLLGAHAIEAASKQEATGPARWLRGRNFPRDGGPGVVTGTLRRSITVFGPVRAGIGAYSAEIGPTVIYGRAVELGNPRWHRAGGYPYMDPGLRKAIAGPVPEIFRVRWATAFRR